MDEIVKMRKERLIKENAQKGKHEYKDFIELNRKNNSNSIIIDAKK